MEPEQERRLALEVARALTAETDPRVPVQDQVRLLRGFGETWKRAQETVADLTGLPPRPRTYVLVSRRVLLSFLVEEQLDKAWRKEIDSPPAGRFLPSVDPVFRAVEAGREAALLPDDGYVKRSQSRVVFVKEKLARVARENGEELGVGPAQLNYAIGVAADAAILDGFPFLDEIPVISARMVSHPLKAHEGLDRDAARFLLGYRAMIQHWAGLSRVVGERPLPEPRLPYPGSAWRRRLHEHVAFPPVGNQAVGARWVSQVADHLGNREFPGLLISGPEDLPALDEWRAPVSRWLDRIHRGGQRPERSKPDR